MSATINILGLRWTPKNRVRPWALAGPIIVLLICIPLLRPLRFPDPRQISGGELARLATVQAIVERHSLAIDPAVSPVPRANTVVVGKEIYANQPATMSILLAGAYWVMTRCGLTFANHGPTVSYLLTLLGVTMPVAAAAGLVYRMARVFELVRPARAALGLACVVSTGLISYATVLNPHAPAAVLVLCSAASLVHVTRSRQPWLTSPWLIVAGFCAALSAAIDPPAVTFLLLFLPVVAALRWPIKLRLAGLALYMIGVAPPLALHSALTVPITGDLLPPAMHAELRPLLLTPAKPVDEDDDLPESFLQRMSGDVSRILWALVGGHGLISHFPIVILGTIGVSRIMHRHWPSSTKVLAGASVIGAAIITVGYAVYRPDWREAMFGARWFIVFTPMLTFWVGAWLRKPHRTSSWAMVGTGVALSTIISLIGATGPIPPGGFDHWTAYSAARNLVTGSFGATADRSAP